MAIKVTLNPICDGWVVHSATPGYLIWANLIAAAGTDADDTDVWAWAYFYTGLAPPANEWRGLYRSFLTFDLVDYGGISLLTALLRIYGNAKGDTSSVSPATNLFGAAPASPTALQASDYATVLDVPLSTAIPYASYVEDGWNEYSLNEDGLTYLRGKLGSTASFSIRNSNYDAAAVAPAWPGALRSAGISWAPTAAGEATKPQLILTYESPRRTVAISDKVTLEAIRNLEMSARGRFNVNKEGDAVYKSRYARNA